MQDQTRLHDESRLQRKPVLQPDDAPKTKTGPGSEKKPAPFGLSPKIQNQSLAPKPTPERYQTPDPQHSLEPQKPPAPKKTREPLPEPGKTFTPKQTETEPPSDKTAPKPKRDDTEQQKPNVSTLNKGLKKAQDDTVSPFDLLIIGVHIVDKVTDDMIEYVKKSHAEAKKYYPNAPFLALPYIIARDDIINPIKQQIKECEEAKRRGFLCLAAPPFFIPGVSPARPPQIELLDLRKSITNELERVFGKSTRKKGRQALKKVPSGSSKLWSLPPVERGTVIEKQLGGNLPGNFPIIDRVRQSGDLASEVASIKSMDITAKTYLRGNAVFNKLQSYIDKLASLPPKLVWADKEVITGPATKRVLELVIPNNGAEAQLSQIQRATAYAKGLGIELRVTRLP